VPEIIKPLVRNVVRFTHLLRTTVRIGQAVTFVGEFAIFEVYTVLMSLLRRTVAGFLIALSLTVAPGCAFLKNSDVMAEKAATVFDLAVDVLTLLDTMVAARLEAPEALPEGHLDALTNATYDLLLARLSLEEATDSYRKGEYLEALSEIKGSVGFMRDCVSQLKSIGANVQGVESILRQLEASLP
jgi:hypothetical protein